MEEIIKGLTEMLIENEVNSKVESRRNWVIRTEIRNEKKVIPYAGSYGKAVDIGWVGPELVMTIVKNSIRWYVFTYKKDYLEALKELESKGFIKTKW